MIPYLYESTETAFTSNGIGRLVDAISCTVTEERNGVYELEMEYPINGALFSEITNSRIIAAVPAEGKAKQPFRIYRIEKPLDGICTIYAEHISYQLSLIPVMPFSANTCAEALAGFVNNAAQPCPFMFWTNKATVANYSVDYPRPIRELLGGSQGSILDVFGTGEYEFDNWLVRLYVNRGADSGVTLRYAKNLTELNKDEDLTNVYTGVCPYWMDMQTGDLVTLPEKAVWASTASNYPYKRTVVVDFSQEWQEKPTVAQLRQRAQKYIADNNIGIPKTSIKVSFVNLADVEGVSIGSPSSTLVIPARVEGDTLKGVNGTINGDTVTLHDAYWKVSYDKYKVLERINLCDTVTVVYEALGVSVTAEVIKTTYNVLLDRYDEIEIGEPKTTLAQQVLSLEQATAQAVAKAGFYANQVANTLTKYVDDQTALITGGQGGFIVFGYNADGQPEEMFIMDTDDMATATNVIRLNKNGIGFSTNGINGPYTSAWTIDGVFNADFIGAGSLSANLITAGTMLADRIMGGTLKLGGARNTNGVLEIYDSSGNLIGSIDNTGAFIKGQIEVQTANYSNAGTTFSAKYDYLHWLSSGVSYSTYKFASFGGEFWINGTPDTKKYWLKANSGPQEMLLTSYFFSHRAVVVGAKSEEINGDQALSQGILFDELIDRSNYRYYMSMVNLSGTSYFSIDIRRSQYVISLGDGATFKLYSTYATINGNTVAYQSSSSRRYKHDIKPLDGDLDPHRLLDLPVFQFRYNKGHTLQYADMEGQTLPGFIAEDVDEHYPSAVIHDHDGKVESWDERRIIPGMLALIQEQADKIKDLESRLALLENFMEEMMNDGK